MATQKIGWVTFALVKFVKKSNPSKNNQREKIKTTVYVLKGCFFYVHPWFRLTFSISLIKNVWTEGEIFHGYGINNFFTLKI